MNGEELIQKITERLTSEGIFPNSENIVARIKSMDFHALISTINYIS